MAAVCVTSESPDGKGTDLGISESQEIGKKQDAGSLGPQMAMWYSVSCQL